MEGRRNKHLSESSLGQLRGRRWPGVRVEGTGREAGWVGGRGACLLQLLSRNNDNQEDVEISETRTKA